jgi:hypothetical protein
MTKWAVATLLAALLLAASGASCQGEAAAPEQPSAALPAPAPAPAAATPQGLPWADNSPRDGEGEGGDDSFVVTAASGDDVTAQDLGAPDAAPPSPGGKTPATSLEPPPPPPPYEASPSPSPDTPSPSPESPSPSPASPSPSPTPSPSPPSPSPALSPSPGPPPPPGINWEAHALIEFKDGLTSAGALSDWFSDTVNPCDPLWTGVTCNADNSLVTQ